MLLEYQKCCVINRGNVTKNFKLQISAPECNPVFAYYLFHALKFIGFNQS